MRALVTNYSTFGMISDLEGGLDLHRPELGGVLNDFRFRGTYRTMP